MMDSLDSHEYRPRAPIKFHNAHTTGI